MKVQSQNIIIGLFILLQVSCLHINKTKKGIFDDIFYNHAKKAIESLKSNENIKASCFGFNSYMAYLNIKNIENSNVFEGNDSELTNNLTCLNKIFPNQIIESLEDKKAFYNFILNPVSVLNIEAKINYFILFFKAEQEENKVFIFDLKHKLITIPFSFSYIKLNNPTQIKTIQFKENKSYYLVKFLLEEFKLIKAYQIPNFKTILELLEKLGKNLERLVIFRDKENHDTKIPNNKYTHNIPNQTVLSDINLRQDENTCAICLENIKEKHENKLSCDHNCQFHNECLNLWLNVNDKCPLCRAIIDKSTPLTMPDDNLLKAMKIFTGIEDDNYFRGTRPYYSKKKRN